MAMYSYNTPTVECTGKMAEKRFKSAVILLWALELQQLACQTSLMLTLNISGILDDLADIPSRSFGYKKKWHFKIDKDFLSFFNSDFLLP